MHHLSSLKQLESDCLDLLFFLYGIGHASRHVVCRQARFSTIPSSCIPHCDDDSSSNSAGSSVGWIACRAHHPHDNGNVDKDDEDEEEKDEEEQEAEEEEEEEGRRSYEEAGEEDEEEDDDC